MAPKITLQSLHANAEINYFTNAAKEIQFGLLAMQTGDAGGDSGISKEEYIGSIAEGILKKIPDEDLRFLKEGTPTPNEVVLLQELERYQTLTNCILKTLMDLKRALKGEIGMSQQLDDLGNSLFNGFLPAPWSKLAPQTEKPLGSWVLKYVFRFFRFGF